MTIIAKRILNSKLKGKDKDLRKGKRLIKIVFQNPLKTKC